MMNAALTGVGIAAAAVSSSEQNNPAVGKGSYTAHPAFLIHCAM